MYRRTRGLLSVILVLTIVGFGFGWTSSNVAQATGAAEAQPNRVVFGTGFLEYCEELFDLAAQFGYGVTQLHATWHYDGAPLGTDYELTWFHDRERFAEKQGVLESEGPQWSWISNGDGSPLDVGTYRVEVLVGGEIVAAGETTINRSAGVGSTEPSFGPARFAEFSEEVSENPSSEDLGGFFMGGCQSPSAQFGPGTLGLDVLWAYRNVTPGDEYSQLWYRDGELLYEETGIFEYDWGTAWHWFEEEDLSPLAAGTYRADVEVDGRVVLSSEVVIAAPGAQSAAGFGGKLPFFGQGDPKSKGEAPTSEFSAEPPLFGQSGFALFGPTP